jgi:hypothetical protein
MYMNCAVVDVVPPGTSGNVHPPKNINSRTTARANAAAQAALSMYPPLFVANLKSVNDCVTKETQDLIFDNPGTSVAFSNRDNSSKKPSFRKGECTGRGSKSAGSSSSLSSSAPPSLPAGSSLGDDGHWHAANNQQQQSASPGGGASSCSKSDGRWYPNCSENSNQQAATDTGGQTAASASTPAQDAGQDLQATAPEDISNGKAPSPQVEQELDAYLGSLYDNSKSNKQQDASLPDSSRHRSDTATADPEGRVAASIAEGQSNGKSKSSAEEERYYDDLYFNRQLQGHHPTTKCDKPKSPCTSPNRWVKNGTCTWTCSRKGRAAVASPGSRKMEYKDVPECDTENDKDAVYTSEHNRLSSTAHATQAAETTTDEIEKQLNALEKTVTRLMGIARKMKTTKRGRRQDDDPTMTHDISSTSGNATTMATDNPSQTSLDIFLIYLARLQNKVIDCIRYVASTIPATTTTPPPVEGAVESTPPQKRQLVVPDFYDPDLEELFDEIAELEMSTPNKRYGDDASQPSDIRSQSDDLPSITASPSPTASAVPSSSPDSDAAAILLYFLGPGPVVLPGANFTWPGPFRPGSNPDNVEDMPMVTNDLDPAPTGEGEDNGEGGDAKDWSGVEDKEGEVEGKDDIGETEGRVGDGDRVQGDEEMWPEFGDGNGDLEDMPALNDDLGLGSEEKVRKWFEEEAEKQKAALAAGHGKE